MHARRESLVRLRRRAEHRHRPFEPLEDTAACGEGAPKYQRRGLSDA
jgi:hypothetical protein